MLYLAIFFIGGGWGFLVARSLVGVLVGGACAVIASVIVVRVAKTRLAAHARQQDEKRGPLDVADAEDAEFVGTYVPHWELNQFIAVVGPGTVEAWQPHFPDAVLAALNIDPGGRHRAGKAYRMRLRGRRGPRGEFGHKGICCRELFITEVLQCEETSGA